MTTERLYADQFEFIRIESWSDPDEVLKPAAGKGWFFVQAVVASSGGGSYGETTGQAHRTSSVESRTIYIWARELAK